MRSIFVERPDPLELRRRIDGWRQVWVWLPVLVAMAVIATESTDTFSSAHTDGWLRPAFEAVFGRFRDANWEELHHLLRKTGHFCGYGLVCLMFLRAWLLELGRQVDVGLVAWRLRSCALAVACQALIASMDEWHQSFIPSRTGTPVDVALDTCGGVFMCGLVWLFFWRRRTGRMAQ